MTSSVRGPFTAARYVRCRSSASVAGGERVIAHAALEEVAGERRLGEVEHVGARVERVGLRP